MSDYCKINGQLIALPGMTARETYFTLLAGYTGYFEREDEKEGDGWVRFTTRLQKGSEKVKIELYEVL